MQSKVKYIDHGVEHVGIYRVDGWMLELTCARGTRRVALGLFEPKALARKLMKVLVVNAERAAAEREIVAAAPPPVVIEASRAGVTSSPRQASAASPA